MKVISPDFNERGGRELARYLDEKLITIYTRKFPNDEVLIRLDESSSIKNEDIILYFPTYPDTNNRIIMLFETLESLKYYGAGKISLILPYLSYSRQDKRFLEGESLSLKLFLDILHYLNVDRLISIDVHNEEAMRKYSKIMVSSITLYSELLKKILDGIVGDKEFILVAPDKGRVPVVSRLAEMFSSKYIYFEKERDRYTGEVRMNPVGEVPRSIYAIIVDDEVSSGGTMANAAKHLKEAGVKNIVTAAIHLLLVNNADDMLFSSGVDYIVGTNTILNPYSILEIEEYIAKLFGK